MENFEKRAQNNVEEYKSELKSQIDRYYQTEANKIQNMKLKPNHQIKLLSNQEKLVANNERVEEAVNFRNELNKLQKKDSERLARTKRDMLRNLSNKIMKTESKEMKKIRDRLSKEKDNLFITRNKETDVLQKQINLHISDIVRIQNSLSNMYLTIGKKEDELTREKERKRKTNETMAEFRSTKSYKASPYTNVISNEDIAMALLNLTTKHLTINSETSKSGFQKNSLMALKYIIRNMKLTRFDINSDYSRKFCNITSENASKGENNYKKKIRKLLEQRKHKDEIMIPPSLYYDVYLEKEVDAKDYRKLLPYISQ